MKAIVLLTVILLAISAKSQSLKEALYGGKLKADTGAVLRKGDSLKIKENMAQKIMADSIRKDSINKLKPSLHWPGKNATDSTNESITKLNTETNRILRTTPDTGVVVATTAADCR